MMPDWERLFGDTTLVQAVLWITAFSLLLGVFIKLWPFIKNAVAIVDALVKLPEIAKQLPVLTGQLTAMKAQVDGIHHETHKNDGSSIKDAVGRVESTAKRLEEGVAGLHGRMDDVDRQLEKLAREDESLWEALDNTSDPKEES